MLVLPQLCPYKPMGLLPYLTDPSSFDPSRARKAHYQLIPQVKGMLSVTARGATTQKFLLSQHLEKQLNLREGKLTFYKKMNTTAKIF